MKQSENADGGREPEAEARPPCIHPCPVDDQACRVVLHLPASAAGVLPVLAKHLPCPWCPRLLLDRVATLPRLGKNERRVLLLAPDPDEPAAVIDPPNPGRSAVVANRRALRTLVRTGLLSTEPEKQGQRSRPAVRLSPLGRAVVVGLRDELQQDRPIPLLRHRATLLAEAQEGDRQLLQRLQSRLTAARDALAHPSQGENPRREDADHLDDLASASLLVQDALAAEK